LFHAQTDNINFFQLAYEYLEALEPEMQQAISTNNTRKIENAVRGFRMLSDGLEGPNDENIDAVARTGIFDLFDRIFIGCSYDLAPYEGQNIKQLQIGTRDGKDLAHAHARNVHKSRVKMAVCKCANAFLLGLKDGFVSTKMLTILDLRIITKQMESCYHLVQEMNNMPQNAVLGLKNIEELREFGLHQTRQTLLDPNDTFKDICLREGTSYFMILKQLKRFDVHDRYISEDALEYEKSAWLFFEKRCGYIEIMRNGCLEPVIFPFLEDATQGDLKHEFVEMYLTERDDFDLKNIQWLDIAVQIIRRLRHKRRLRGKKRSAFAVDYYDQICASTLWIVVLLHVLMIAGGTGYRDNDNLESWIEQATSNFSVANNSFGASQKFFSVQDTTLKRPVKITSSDMEFYYNVHPTVDILVQCTMLINLVLCCVRFLAFARAEVPLIVQRGFEEDAARRHQETSQRAEQNADDDMQEREAHGPHHHHHHFFSHRYHRRHHKSEDRQQADTNHGKALSRVRSLFEPPETPARRPSIPNIRMGSAGIGLMKMPVGDEESSGRDDRERECSGEHADSKDNSQTNGQMQRRLQQFSSIRLLPARPLRIEERASLWNVCSRRGLWLVLSSGQARYEICFLFCAALAVASGTPEYTAYSLLEVCFWR
jgi:hypothetical protein